MTQWEYKLLEEEIVEGEIRGLRMFGPQGWEAVGFSVQRFPELPNPRGGAPLQEESAYATVLLKRRLERASDTDVI